MAGPRITLVRHAEWDRRSDKPTKNGEQQAQAARTRLEGTLRKAGAVVLSSAAERAMHMGRTLVSGLEVPFYSSPRIEIGGNRADGIESLDLFVGRALAEAGVQMSEESPLIVVTHKPMMDIANQGQPTDYGDVLEYEPDSWRPPNFLPIFEQAIEREIAARIAG